MSGCLSKVQFVHIAYARLTTLSWPLTKFAETWFLSFVQAFGIGRENLNESLERFSPVTGEKDSKL